jgi:Deoxyribonuclease NucA/NucB
VGGHLGVTVATGTKGGVLLVAIAVVGAVAVFGGNEVVDTVTGLFGGIGSATEIIGEGDAQVMIARQARAETARCDTRQMISDKRCGDRKLVVIDAAKMPFIARNISLAWGEGHKFLLTRDANETNRDARFRKSCRSGRYTKQYQFGSCDEYAFASTHEGGQGSRIEEVPLREQKCQGGTVSRAYQNVPINDGDQFMVVISNPDRIASEPYHGVDVAKEQSCGI